MGNFLNTIYGSWLKMFIAAVITTYLVKLSEGASLFTWDRAMAESLLTAGLVGVLPVIVNWLNPSDTRYGIKKQE